MAPNFRNHPPKHGIRVSADAMQAFAAELLQAGGMDHDGATLVARNLVACDLRCVFSHGTRALAKYLPRLVDGSVNPRPRVRVERQDGPTAVVDGDGGLGYHACNLGMALAVAQARQYGVGTVTTYHHHHIGAAGLWTRLALDQDCVGMAFSGHRFEPAPDERVTGAAKSSPISVAIPSRDQPPIVLDMGARFLPETGELMEAFPMAFLKSLGVGAVNLALGGLLAGIRRPEAMPPCSPWRVNQGSFLAAWDVARFMDPDRFKAEMDRYIARARTLRPLPPFERAELAGGPEYWWEQENLREGIPVSQEHRDLLTDLAREFAVETPWRRAHD